MSISRLLNSFPVQPSKYNLSSLPMSEIAYSIVNFLERCPGKIVKSDPPLKDQLVGLWMSPLFGSGLLIFSNPSEASGEDQSFSVDMKRLVFYNDIGSFLMYPHPYPYVKAYFKTLKAAKQYTKELVISSEFLYWFFSRFKDIPTYSISVGGGGISLKFPDVVIGLGTDPEKVLYKKSTMSGQSGETTGTPDQPSDED